MNTAVLFALLLCQKLLFLYLCMYVCARHPGYAPLKRKASPQRSLRQLHPTTWPLDNMPAHHSLHVPHFRFFFVPPGAYLLNFSSLHSLHFYTDVLLVKRPCCSLLGVVWAMPSLFFFFCRLTFCCKQLSHTEYVLWCAFSAVFPWCLMAQVWGQH